MKEIPKLRVRIDHSWDYDLYLLFLFTRQLRLVTIIMLEKGELISEFPKTKNPATKYGSLKTKPN